MQYSWHHYTHWIYLLNKNLVLKKDQCFATSKNLPFLKWMFIINIYYLYYHLSIFFTMIQKLFIWFAMYLYHMSFLSSPLDIHPRTVLLPCHISLVQNSVCYTCPGSCNRNDHLNKLKIIIKEVNWMSWFYFFFLLHQGKITYNVACHFWNIEIIIVLKQSFQ